MKITKNSDIITPEQEITKIVDMEDFLVTKFSSKRENWNETRQHVEATLRLSGMYDNRYSDNDVKNTAIFYTDMLIGPVNGLYISSPNYTKEDFLNAVLKMMKDPKNFYRK